MRGDDQAVPRGLFRVSSATSSELPLCVVVQCRRRDGTVSESLDRPAGACGTIDVARVRRAALRLSVPQVAPATLGGDLLYRAL
jgi:hypothetical protein